MFETVRQESGTDDFLHGVFSVLRLVHQQTGESGRESSVLGGDIQEPSE